jgi:aminopeptidase N
MKLLNENSYQKGGWVLHMLRRQLGDSIFKKCIRKYYESYAGKNADTDDFRKIVESVAGKDLKKFFQQWLYTPQNLKLDISWKYNKKENNIAVTVKQLQTAGAFQFPFEMLIQETSTSIAKKISRNITKASEIILISVKTKPVKVEADPNSSLLFEGSIKELK